MNYAVVLRNEDVSRIVAEVPEEHQHLRTTLILADGSTITMQEATVAAIVRAFISIKTDPIRTKVVMNGRAMDVRKAGFAVWQLVEE
ncbi:MAG: hypothetical protein JRE16_06725 [Deltaproteobacteria bacterium]|jgi:hypothetical protein|nr:hypothetical protein [Deltaproteobacteria bacterium]